METLFFYDYFSLILYLKFDAGALSLEYLFISSNFFFSVQVTEMCLCRTK